MNEPIILHPDQAEDPRRLLGVVEDWLLHASFEVLDELGGFLTSLGWSQSRAPERVTAQLICDLGDATITLGPQAPVPPSITAQPPPTNHEPRPA